MTFKEAHESGKRYRRLGEKYDDFRREGGMISVDDALAEDWALEPEVYEIECKWEDCGTIFPTSMEGRRFFEKLIGKRTRLKIEVLP